MAGSTLFGYTVEEDEGKIVITLTGAIAQSLLQRYSAEGVGRNPRLLSSLLPFGNLDPARRFCGRAIRRSERCRSRPNRPTSRTSSARVLIAVTASSRRN